MSKNYDFSELVSDYRNEGKVGGTKKQRIDLIKKEVMPLQELAYERLQMLNEEHVAGFSGALMDAKKSIPKKNDGKLFDLESKRTFRELSREVARIQKFLSEEDSKIEIAQHNKDIVVHASNWKGDFGNQWKNKYGESYNKAKISEDQAEAMFSIYRSLESTYGHLLLKGAGGFGSDNLIYMIADYVVENGASGHFSDSDPQFAFFSEIQEKLNEYDKLKNAQGEEEYATGDIDTDLLNKASSFKINKSAEDVLKSWLF